MSCIGPCLPHCRTWTTALLATASLVYVIACVGYMVLARSMSTPFGDSLTKQQRVLLQQSKRDRGKAFAVSTLAAIAVVVAWRPLA